MLISIFWQEKIDLRRVFRCIYNVFKYKNIANMGSDPNTLPQYIIANMGSDPNTFCIFRWLLAVGINATYIKIIGREKLISTN